jgi:hypothetical protein
MGLFCGQLAKQILEVQSDCSVDIGPNKFCRYNETVLWRANHINFGVTIRLLCGQLA